VWPDSWLSQAERIRDHVRRPHPETMIMDRIMFTVYLIDPRWSACEGSASPEALGR
jgi:hypothetical protein